jgi:hypothetical protein
VVGHIKGLATIHLIGGDVPLLLGALPFVFLERALDEGVEVFSLQESHRLRVTVLARLGKLGNGDEDRAILGQPAKRLAAVDTVLESLLDKGLGNGGLVRHSLFQIGQQPILGADQTLQMDNHRGPGGHHGQVVPGITRSDRPNRKGKGSSGQRKGQKPAPQAFAGPVLRGAKGGGKSLHCLDSMRLKRLCGRNDAEIGSIPVP